VVQFDEEWDDTTGMPNAQNVTTKLSSDNDRDCHSGSSSGRVGNTGAAVLAAVVAAQTTMVEGRVVTLPVPGRHLPQDNYDNARHWVAPWLPLLLAMLLGMCTGAALRAWLSSRQTTRRSQPGTDPQPTTAAAPQMSKGNGKWNRWSNHFHNHDNPRPSSRPQAPALTTMIKPENQAEPTMGPALQGSSDTPKGPQTSRSRSSAISRILPPVILAAQARAIAATSRDLAKKDVRLQLHPLWEPMGPTTTQLPLILVAMAFGMLIGAKLQTGLASRWATKAALGAAAPTTPAKSEELASHTANDGRGTEGDYASQGVPRQRAPTGKHGRDNIEPVSDSVNVPGKSDLTHLGVPADPGEQYACWLSTPCTSFCDYGTSYNGGLGGSNGPSLRARTAAKQANAVAHRDHRLSVLAQEVTDGNWEQALTSEAWEDCDGNFQDSLSFSQGDRIIRINREAKYDFWQWEELKGTNKQGWVPKRLFNRPPRGITATTPQTQPVTASLLRHNPDVGMATRASDEGEPPASKQMNKEE
jgi:hypothetical protein